MPIVRIDKPEIYVGMTTEIAKKDIEDHGYECRVVHVDNRTIHADYKPDYDPLRVNLHVTKGRVSKATIG